MTASELYCRQAGLRPVGMDAEAQTTCVFCGATIAQGEPCSHFRPDDGFTNGPDLCARDRSRDILCGYCVHLKNAELMTKTQNVCITAHDLVPMSKLEHKKWLLLNPPDPPFVVVQSDTKRAHLIWRTPVTVSKELWYVRLGRRQLMVRMPLIREAVQRFSAIAARFADAQPAQKKQQRYPLRSPFTSLGYGLDEMDFWRLRSDVEPYLSKEDVDLIYKLRPGEYWALAVLTTKNEPVNPLEQKNKLK